MRRAHTVITLLLLLALHPGAADAAQQVRIYQPDGSRQCGEGRELGLEEMARPLREAGIAIRSAEKRRLPIMVGTACGMPTGIANTYVISAADWRRLEQRGGLGFKRWDWRRR